MITWNLIAGLACSHALCLLGGGIFFTGEDEDIRVVGFVCMLSGIGLASGFLTYMGTLVQ